VTGSALALGVLMIVAAVALVFYKSAAYAVFASFISAYALVTFFDVWKAEIVAAMREDRPISRDEDPG